MTFRLTVVLSVLVTFIPLAAAQAPAEPDGNRPRMRQIGQRGDPQRRLTGWQDRMAEELELDDSQKAQLDEIMAPFREQMRKRGETFRQLREAEESGDTALADQLREQVRSEFAPGADQARQEMMDSVATQVEGILRPDQIEQFREMRHRMQERWAQGQQQRQMMRDLPDRLNLDEEQRTQFRQMARDEFRNRRSRAERVGEMGEQAQGAVDQGDMESAANLREEIEANVNPEARMQEFLTRVETILTDEQKPQLAQFREELASAAAAPEGQAGPSARAPNIRNLFRAVRRLNLNAGQEEDVRDIEREAMRAQRGIGVRDTEARQELFDGTRAKIESLLNDAQKSELAKSLQRNRGRGR